MGSVDFPFISEDTVSVSSVFCDFIGVHVRHHDLFIGLLANFYFGRVGDVHSYVILLLGELLCWISPLLDSAFHIDWWDMHRH